MDVANRGSTPGSVAPGWHESAARGMLSPHLDFATSYDRQ